MASQSWSRRNARARSLGFRNYYDYRMHNYGERPPSEPPARGTERAHLIGHRSPEALGRLADQGRIELVKVEPKKKDDEGRWIEGNLRVVLSDGRQVDFPLKGKQMEAGRMAKLYQRLVAGGATVIDSPSLDLFGRFSGQSLAEAA